MNPHDLSIYEEMVKQGSMRNPDISLRPVNGGEGAIHIWFKEGFAAYNPGDNDFQVSKIMVQETDNGEFTLYVQDALDKESYFALPNEVYEAYRESLMKEALPNWS